MESINGCEKVIEYDKLTICNTCKGTKSRLGYNTVDCKVCKGTGVRFQKHGSLLMQSDCDVCGGEGNIIRNPCLY